MLSLLTLLSFPVTDLTSNETNQHPRDTLCNMRQNRPFHLLGLTLPKMDLGLEIQKNNFEISIRILNIPFVPIFMQNKRIWPFWPKFPQNRFLVWNSENKCWNKNQHLPDTICANFQAKQTTLTFLARIRPKRNFKTGNSETNVGIRISIPEIPWVPMFRQNAQLWYF